jgi:hypothetical protein
MLDLWWAAPLTDEPAKNVLLSLNPNADAVYIYSKRSYLEVAPWGWSCLPYRASNRRARASRFSRELKLIDQVFFNSYVSCLHEPDEPVGERMLLVKHPGHFTLLDDKHSGRGNRGGCSDANGLTC